MDSHNPIASRSEGALDKIRALKLGSKVTMGSNRLFIRFGTHILTDRVADSYKFSHAEFGTSTSLKERELIDLYALGYLEIEDGNSNT